MLKYAVLCGAWQTIVKNAGPADTSADNLYNIMPSMTCTRTHTKLRCALLTVYTRLVICPLFPGVNDDDPLHPSRLHQAHAEARSKWALDPIKMSR